MMITAAEQGGAVLQVGHIERFNPAICTLHEQLEEGSAVTRIAARRHNSPQDRTYDIDAVLDLMIHDLELLSLFTNQDVSDVRVSSGATEHAVKAGFTIGGEISVELSADRKTGSPVREMIVETEDSIYTVDFTSQQLHRLTPTGGEEISVEREDALRRQLKAFAKATGSGTVEGATGDDGLTALQLANQIRSVAGLI
jgi:predicted dehydrogenase